MLWCLPGFPECLDNPTSLCRNEPLLLPHLGSRARTQPLLRSRQSSAQKTFCFCFTLAAGLLAAAARRRWEGLGHRRLRKSCPAEQAVICG